MADDTKVLDFVSKFKEKTESHKYKYIPPEILKELETNISTEDYQAFFRVLETIRSIGDESAIVMTNTSIDISVSQFPEEAIEVPDTFAMKSVEITQRIGFDCSPIVDLDLTDEKMAEYIIKAAEDIRESIISLIYWHDGSIHEEDQD